MAGRRNLIIITTHGLRADVAGAGQVWPAVAPTMQTLSERGARLIATSACPADGGAMVSLLTGLHARQHGCTDSTNGQLPNCQGWPAWLRENSYHLAGVGCVDLFADALADKVRVAPISDVDPAGCAYADAMRTQNLWPALSQQRKARARSGPFEPDRLLIEPNQDVDGFIARQALDALDRLPTDKPWALIVAFTGPGNDLPAPTPYDELVSAKELEAGFLPPDLRRLDAMAQLDWPRILLQRLSATQLARIRGDYLGRVALIDHGLDKLTKRAALREDHDRTWLVLASDRGQLLGEHGLVGHRSFLCASVEVPFILCPLKSNPNAQNPTEETAYQVDALASSVDVAATIAALAGCDVPPAVVGRSLVPAIYNQPIETLASQTGCVSEFGRRLMLETERHKIIFDVDARVPIGLYDLLNDPDEKDNLTESMVGRNMLDALRWRVADALMALRSPAAH